MCSQSSVTFTTLPQAPGAVADFDLKIGSVTAAGATVTWTAATTAGVPAEAYYVQCWVAPGGTDCNSLNPDFASDPLSRGAGSTLKQALTGLTPSTDYRCFLGGRNTATAPGADVCATSIPVTFKTSPTPPSAVTDFDLATGSVTTTGAIVTWTAASVAGVPAEVYYVKCSYTESNPACEDLPPFAYAPVPRALWSLSWVMSHNQGL